MLKFTKISDFTQVITGGTPSTRIKEYWEGGKIPWLNSGELNQNIIKSSRNYITELGLNKSSAKLLPKDSVLIALTGATTGVVGYLTFEASANQSVTGILPSENHYPKYLYYYLKSIRSKVMDDAYGGGQPHISQKYVKDIKIPLPDLATQKRIAQILDDAAALRDKTKQLLEEYDKLAKAIFLDMFGDPGLNPFSWDFHVLGKHIDLLTDYHANGSYKILNKHVTLLNEENYALMVRTTDLENNNYTSNVNYITREAYNFLKKSKVYGGEIIINKIGSAGNIYLMPNLNRPVSLGMNAFLLRFKESLNNIFTYYFLKSKYGENQILKRVKGAVTKTIRKDAVREIPIIVPPIELQNHFAEKITLIEQQKELAKQELRQSEDLFNCLLQKAFKGEL